MQRREFINALGSSAITMAITVIAAAFSLSAPAHEQVSSRGIQQGWPPESRPLDLRTGLRSQ